MSLLRWRCWIVVCAAFLFVGGFASSSDSAFLSLPLIPHRVQQARSRRLLQQEVVPLATGEVSLWNYSAISSSSSSSGARSRDQRELGARTVGALYQGYGTHYVDLWCGTPPQRQTLIVDTGSAVTAFPCAACKDCGKKYHIDNVFRENQSPSYSVLPCDECQRGRCIAKGNGKCTIGMSYQEGSSWSAVESKDTCYVGGPHGVPLDAPSSGDVVVEEEDVDVDVDLDPQSASDYAFDLIFGCQTRLTGLFKTQLADGIMGMDSAKESFWKQMYKAQKIPNQIFSLCFSRQPLASRSGTEAGAMTLGGFDTRLHKTDLVYASYAVSSSFYAVHLRKIYLREGGGGDSAMPTKDGLNVKAVDISEGVLNSATTIVDSGTTDTYFMRQLSSPFKSIWYEYTGKKYTNDPVSLTDDELNALPTILFQLSGAETLNKMASGKDPNSLAGLAGDIDPDHPYDVILAMPPTHYMEYDDESGQYVPRFYLEESRGSVLGANAMMGHDVVFDADNKRLGFAESDCDYAAAVKAAGFEWELSGSIEISSKAEQQDSKAKDEEDELTVVASHGNENEANDGFCTGNTCRGSIIGGFLIVLSLLVATRRRLYNKVDLEEITEGLELQESTNEKDFERYADEPTVEILDDRSLDEEELE